MSRSNVITSVVVGGFVAIVIIGLVFAYVVYPPSQNRSSTTQALYVSQITLVAGSASTNSLNGTCSGDAELEVYVSNGSPNTLYLTNVTIFASRLSANATTLVPLSNGCIPVSEDNPQILSGANDLLVLTYPDISIPFPSSWNVTISFNNGQNFTQRSLISVPPG